MRLKYGLKVRHLLSVFFTTKPTISSPQIPLRFNLLILYYYFYGTELAVTICTSEEVTQ